MLRYRILKTDKEKQIGITLNAGNVDVKNINDEGLYSSVINSPVNLEKEAYVPIAPYKLTFNFFDGTYASDFTKAGFTFPADLKKNAYKKSMFLVEFYDNLVSKNRLFSNSLSTYPNINGKKGPVSNLVNGVRDVVSIYDINQIPNELYLIFNNRVFDNFTDIKIENGKRYSSMYVRTMFLNAKTGKVHYFISDTDTSTLPSSPEFKDNLFYCEIRFYEDYTYSFIQNGIKQNDIYFKELVIT